MSDSSYVAIKDGAGAPVDYGAVPVASPQPPQCRQKLAAILKNEDNTSLLVSFAIFVFVVLISLHWSNPILMEEWYLDMILLAIPFLACYASCTAMGEPFAPKDWATLVVATYFADAVGSIPELKHRGIGSALWAILLGIVLQRFELKIGLKAEYFIKIGIVLGTVNIPDVIAIGGEGLVVAWVDTIILICGFMAIIAALRLIDLKTAMLTVGATCICGSSAATSIYGVIGGEKDILNFVIALIGIANIPLIPLMPLARNTIAQNPAVMGAWLGGSVDSTGQVIAAATICNDPITMTVATVIKMTQNVLIGPVCFVLSIIVERKCNPRILIEKFPRFVAGFIVSSLIVSYVVPHYMTIAVRANSAYMSEWFSLLGFVLIGTELKLGEVLKNRNNLLIVGIYLVVQMTDIWSTYGWAILMFG